MERGSCRCRRIGGLDRKAEMWRHKWWSVRSTGPECTGSQRNAGNCISVTATSKHLVPVMRFNSLNIYMYEEKS